MDIFEEIKEVISQTKYTTMSYSHGEIYEVILRRIEIFKMEKRNDKEGAV